MILIAEDEEPIRVLAESILQEHGMPTITAANAEEALALIEADEAIDILFTDINLGDTSGIDLAVAARARRPDMKVLYTSGAGITDGTRALFVEGADFLPKAYRADELLAAIAAVGAN